MKKFVLGIILLLSIISMAHAKDDDPCGIYKIGAALNDQRLVVNCYLWQAIHAYQVDYEAILEETPESRADADAKWSAVEAIDSAIAEIKALMIPDAESTDIRRNEPYVADAKSK